MRCLIAFLFCTTALYAQDASLIKRQGIEAHLYFLASDALEGRKAGTHNGRIAAEYIRAELAEWGVKAFFNDYFQSFEALAPVSSGKKPVYQSNPDSIARIKQKDVYHVLHLQNVLGIVEGKLRDEYVILGAHYDHLGIDATLAGDRIYNGADDNASGVAAALQVAKAIALSGVKPLRSIIFAFWDGEEEGCLGSEFFAATFKDLPAVKAYINLDMLGRGGVAPVFTPRFSLPPQQEGDEKNLYLYHSELFATLGESIASKTAKATPDISVKTKVIGSNTRGSDNYSFAVRDVPVLWFFSGVTPLYHTPADEAPSIDYDKLTSVTQCIHLTLLQLANSKN
ncbi:MAG: M20/M25/M40 family metallo-hydrolase [Dysgonamonadaceae bacterium]|nr:M20/M25/M40 family metallo-hydrolase [Dysgonamonadaceae bacterium]